MEIQDNQKMKEIFDLLLMAGYFRIRIPSISVFDKVLGGLAWCITCSNFDIDIDYNDDMTMGQKIKLSEKVVKALQRMNSPFLISPHQIQGLDFPNLFPIFQWLIKFVLETREYRQDYNKSMSSYLGQKTYEEKEKEQHHQNNIIKENILNYYSHDRRITKNSKIKKFSKRDPLRTYSSLIEFDDKTAYGPYNKLCALMAGGSVSGKKVDDKGKKVDSTQPGKPGQQPKDPKLLGRQQTSEAKKMQAGGATGKTAQIEYNIFLEENLENVGTGEEAAFEQIDFNLEAEEQVNFRKLERRQSKIGENLFHLVSENKEKIAESIKNYEEQNTELEFATLIINEKENHEREKARIKRKLEEASRIIEESEKTKKQVEQKSLETKKKKDDFLNSIKELEETISIIQEKIAKARKNTSEKEINRLREMIEQQNELKERKVQLKKEVKAKMQEYERLKREAEENVPQVDESVLRGLQEDLEKKRSKYDKVYKEYALSNQQIAVLQRKLENYPSAIEIAQYHQRFIELFDKINMEMEKYRDSFISFNNMQDVRTILMQHVELMRSFKETYGEIYTTTSKSKREEFIKNLQQALVGLQDNQKKSADVLEKSKSIKEKNSEILNGLLALEREYYKLLKDMQMEFQKNEFLNSQLDRE